MKIPQGLARQNLKIDTSKFKKYDGRVSIPEDSNYDYKVKFLKSYN